MVLEEICNLLKTLNEQFSNNLNENDQNVIAKAESLSILISGIKDITNKFQLVLLNLTLKNDERELLSTYFAWLFNELIFISVNSNNILYQCNTELQKVVLSNTYKKERWWFFKLISAYSSFLKQATSQAETEESPFSQPLELIPHFAPSEELLTKHSVKLTFHKIVISNKKQLDNLVHTCFLQLTLATPFYCNKAKDHEIEVRNLILDIFCCRSLECKAQSITFFRKYFSVLVEFKDEHTKLFVSIMQTMSIVFKDFPSWIGNHKEAVEKLITSIEQFLKELPVKLIDFSDSENLRLFVTYASEISFHQILNIKKPWFNMKIPEQLSTILMTVLDNNDYPPHAVESFRNLLEFDDQSINTLMKYLIIAELESAKTFDLKLSEMSQSWKSLQHRAVKKVNELHSVSQTKLVAYYESISDFFLLAVQVEFMITQHHQFRHGMAPQTCICSKAVNLLESREPLMRFKDWNYKHISFLLIESIEDITRKLLSALEKSTNVDNLVRCAIDIFSCIIKLSTTSSMAETLKQIIVAIVASPFYKCLKDHPNFCKLGGFLKVMELLPSKLKHFFLTTDLDPKILDKLRCDSIVQLSQLEISRVSNSCWWLVENMIQYTSTHGSIEMKSTLFNCFTNFVVNNSDKFGYCIEIYQNLMNSFKDPLIVVEPLHSVLCMTGRNFVVLKTLVKENIFMHTIVCNDCELTSVIYPKGKSQEDEIKRWMAFMKETGGMLVSPDIIKQLTKSLQLNMQTLLAQSDEFKIELFPKLPAIINHSKDFKTFLEKDHGKAFFEGIFVKNEKVLVKLNQNLKDIIRNMLKMDYSEVFKTAVFDNCYAGLVDINEFTAYGSDANLQYLVISLTFIFATNVVNEGNTVKCLKILLHYIVRYNSEVMGPASQLALQMAELNGTSLEQLFCWHKTFIIRHLTLLICTNLSIHGISLIASFANFAKRLNIQLFRDFIPRNIGTIIAVVLPLGVRDNNFIDKLNELCTSIPLAQAIEDNFINIYFSIYTRKPQICQKCLKFIQDTTGKSIKQLLTKDKKKTVDEILVYYNSSSKFVFDVMKVLLDKDSQEDSEGNLLDDIAQDIKQRFLGVLIYFEPFLTSNVCERIIKRYILLSLGDIIRLLEHYISGFCFKIITILKAAVEQTSMDLSEVCIEVWDILIRKCDVTSLAPILSTIFVSLDFFIDKYPEKVASIHKYLIIDNETLLSRSFTDLFFIEKTRADTKIKDIVRNIIDSQKSKEEFSFRDNFQLLLRQMNSDNSDLQIRVYCLQYLKDLIRENRAEVNGLISGQMKMDPMIEELLHVLVNNCKNTTSEALQLATAECIGELGAIEPGLQKQNYASQVLSPKTIHCDEFAMIALVQLCRSYQYKNDPKYIDSLSLAIQEILSSRNVTIENKDDSEVWLAIPEKMRPLMESLLTSSYCPKPVAASLAHPVFWNTAQTASEWAYKWSAKLIENIPHEDTKRLLECIKPSMRHNQYTTSMFLPYIVLHSLTMSDHSKHDLIREEIKTIFDIVNGNDGLIQQQKKAGAHKPLYVKLHDFKPLATEKTPAENGIKLVAINAAKMIFEVFDFLENSLRTHTDNDHVQSVIGKFLNSFDLEEMANVNYKCGEYSRAMIYLETKLKKLREDKNSSEAFQSKLFFLTQIYAMLECPDAVEGVQALKTSEWMLEEKILIKNVTGNFEDSAACFERLMQIGESKIGHVNIMMDTYISLDQPETALLIYEKMIQKFNNSEKNLCKEMKAEPLWRLSRFDELDELLADKTVQDSNNWGVRCGKLLSTFHKLVENEQDGTLKFHGELRNTRLALIRNLKISGSEQTAYSKNYRGMINLHLISEVEKAEAALEEIKHTQDASILQKFIEESNTRMEFIRKNSMFEESILCFHRVILSVFKTVLSGLKERIAPTDYWGDLFKVIDDEMGKLWIKSTRLACNNKKYQQAQTFILNAEQYEPISLFIEKAELHWIMKDQANAFKILELGTKKIWDVEDRNLLSEEEKRNYVKGKLMIALYNAEAVNVDFETNKKLFLEAKVSGAGNEKLYLLIAEYIDRFYCTEDDNQGARIGQPNQMRELISYYFKSMTYGSEYVFQSMPRVLSIWLDTTAKFQNNHKEVTELNKAASKIVETLDMFNFYTAFSQLISRICHPCPEVFVILKTILVKLILIYPQQSLWFLVPVLKSSHPQRVKKCKEILSDARVNKFQPLIQDFNWVVDRFIKIATTTMHGSLSLDHHVPDLHLLNKKSKIIIPFQCNLQLTRVFKGNSFKFPDKLVNIQTIESKVEIMQSLQKPKKVTFRGDDGKKYTVLIKANDDTRIDLRYCEFSNVLKEFLHKDPESRHRQLTTRTFSVIPLNESAGLIEWVPNLKTFKDIIYHEYNKKKRKLPTNLDLKNMNLPNLDKETRIAKFRKLKEIFYPALGDYFRQQFTTPQNFYQARSAFIKTTAAMSMIGYILGLGDRHSQNILIDELSGETFHVDFNMLFNRGELLAVPETVPFRLTHNMIDAMGVLGIEGPFKKNCEIILRVLQKEKNTLMSYLRPLIYDTVTKNNEAWKRTAESKKGDNERVELDAVKFNKKIEMRLKGIVSKYKGSSEIELSTEGQVNFIITEATSEENLSAMFFGWMPWI